MIKSTYLNNSVFIFFLGMLCSCDDDRPNTLVNRIIIYEWGTKTLPVKAKLLEYGRDAFDEDSLHAYSDFTFGIERDTLNKVDYLALDFKTADRKLPIKHDYKLLINDSIVYKIFDIRKIPKTQGNGLKYWINDSTFRDVMDDEPITFYRKD